MVKIAIVGLLIVVYWFVLKPADVRCQCREEARQEAVLVVTEEIEVDEETRRLIQGDYEQLTYEECLEEKGLEE